MVNPPEFAASPTPVGSGARALGMANAFIAIADDATAASWNPAGLVQLERPEISMVLSYNRIYEDFFADAMHPEVAAAHGDKKYELNFLSAVYPLPFLVAGRNATVSLAYQRKYDFTRSFNTDFDQQFTRTNGNLRETFQNIDFQQSGGLATISPAFAIEITPRLSVGAAVNIWRSSFLSENGWTQDLKFDVEVTEAARELRILGGIEQRERYSDFAAENFTFGVLWTPAYKWSLGFRYDTGFKGDVKYRLEGAGFQYDTPRPARPRGLYDAFRFSKSETREMRFPSFASLGLAYRANDRLTLSFDATRADWNDFYIKDGSGVRASLVDGGDIDDPDAIDFDPTYSLRLGVEYVFIPKEPEKTLNRLWTLRGGLLFEQEPASGAATADDGGGDADDYYGFAVGAGVLLNQRINIDAAYQFRFGNDVNSDLIGGIPGFSEDVYQHRLLLSTVIYF